MNKKIGIIGAMPVEINLLKEKIDNLTIEKHGDFEFYSGKLNNADVTILLSGIGKVSAAIGTTLLIEKFQPGIILNTGTAGGLNDTVMGDIIVADKVCYHDVDVTAFGYKLGQMAGQPESFLTDSNLVTKIINSINKIDNPPNYKKGLILSGDSFVSDKNLLLTIKTNFPTALAVEMESTAIAQTCKQLNIPFVVIRAISDMAGEGDSKSFDSFVATAGMISAEIVINFINNLD